ncbi:MAG TPA: FUSC family membrane protein [Chitinophagaceae bacterium]|nr:FUSC family membrane protein [Chitinophagaceae bacterium]
MDLIKEYKSFINSYYLGEGLRITTGAVLPAVILNHFGWLSIGVLVSLGAVCVSAVDSPGPIHHRRNGMQVCSILMFFVCVITGYVAPYPWLLGSWIAIACFVFSMIAVYGGRVISIGIAALLVLVLNLTRNAHGVTVLINALYVTGGALWYMLLSLVLYHVRPYKLIQQALGDCIMATADYLRTRSRFYDPQVVYDEVYRELMDQQVQVQHKQDLLRELLYKSRTLVKDSTVTSRTLMMLFIDTVDLFEKSATSFYPYENLHRFFDQSDVLIRFKDCVVTIADELDDIGIAVKSGRASDPPIALQNKLSALQQYFTQFRDEHLSSEKLEAIITLRKILQAIEDMTARINTLHHATKYDKKRARDFKPTGDHDLFVTHTDISWKILRDNLSIKSDIFRHSLRVSIAATAGYVLSNFFTLGHSYWILLTIIVILKPAYSLTKKRNYQRVLGTMAGALAGVLMLYFIKDNTVLFFIMLLLMTGTYSFVRTNYLLAVIFMTPYVLLLFHLLNNGQFRSIITDRIIDTVIGSAIAFAANFLFLPSWEQEQIKKYQAAAITASLEYYKSVCQSFLGNPAADTEFRLNRKQAFVALANLSDAFSRLLAEPKSKQKNALQLHQFVVLAHTLTSHIATLAHFSKTLAAKYQSQDFQPIIEQTTQRLQAAESALIEDNKGAAAALPVPQQPFEPGRQVKELLAKRNEELQKGEVLTETRVKLLELKPIVDQFQFIDSIAKDLAHSAAGKTV